MVIAAVATCAVIPMAVYAVRKHMKSREDADIPEEPEWNVKYEKKVYLNGQEVGGVMEKPDIFSLDLGSDTDGDAPMMVQSLWAKNGEEAEEEDLPEPKTIISKKKWNELREKDGYVDRVATYFWQDDIFAGVDDKLDILDKEESFGGIPPKAFEEASDKGGAYVLCGDGVTLLEIYGSDGNFLEELKAVYAGENAED